MSTPDDAVLDTGMRIKLSLRLVFGTVIIGAMLFLPAGTWRFWPGWLWMGVLLTPMFAASLYFLRTDPALLARRMQMKESREAQRKIIPLTQLVFFAGFLVPGFDHRFGWSSLPTWVVIAANVGVFAGYVFVLWVMKTNSYASRTIQVEEHQVVIDTGPYAYVRHPMYTGVTVMMLSSPLALGSIWALLPFLILPALLVWRIRDEERALREQLAGYVEYCERVRWRMLPGLY